MLTVEDLLVLNPDGTETNNDVHPEHNSGPDEENVRAQIEPYRADALEIIDSLDAIEIVDEESNEMVGELLRTTHENLKAIEAKRKEATAPLMQAKKAIDAWFKPAKTALEDAKALLKRKSEQWYRDQETRRQAALDSGDVETALATPEATTSTATATRKVWTIEIVNADLVPRDYMVVDEGKIREAMNVHGPENVEIPGIKISQETKIVMGR